MIESIKRLYDDGSMSYDGIINAVVKRLITEEQAFEIMKLEDDLEFAKELKLKDMSITCNDIIKNGVDVQIGDRVDHFNLEQEDQSNISNLFRVIELGGTEFPYQADNGKCTIYTALDICNIYISAQTLITTQITYHNAIKSYIKSIDNIDELKLVEYGMVLPEQYASEMMSKLEIAQTQMNNIIERFSSI